MSEPLISSRAFAILAFAGSLMVVAGILVFAAEHPRFKVTGADCAGKAPSSFEKLELPRRAGCWIIQLNPNRFSRKVCLPDGVNFRLEWEKNTPAVIKNGFGKKIPRNRPQTQRYDHGNHAGNKVLQFKGQGWVKIYLTPKS